MKIYRLTEDQNKVSTIVEVCDLTIDNRTTITRRVMVENTISVSVSTPKDSPLPVKILDFTDFENERYVILDEPQYSLKDEVLEYTILLKGNLHRLEYYMMPDEGNDEWFYYGRALEHIDRVIAILNTKEPGWTLDDESRKTINAQTITETKNINYANTTILSALHTICSAENGWNLEFNLVGKKFFFDKKIKNATSLRFEYGQGKGLYEMSRSERSDDGIVTRLVAYGGTANMVNAKRLSFADQNGGLDYLERNVDKYGLRETRINYDHIYPQLSDNAIDSDAKQVEEGKQNWTVSDKKIGFNLKDQVLDDAVIFFNTGDCAGLEFNIIAFDDLTKTITFKEVNEKRGNETYVLPNEVRFPKAGDKYTLVNILMPDQYLVAAQNKLKQTAQEELDRISAPQYSYTISCDPRYFKKLGVSPHAGDECKIVDSIRGNQAEYSARIVGVEYPVLDRWAINLTISDKIDIPSSVKMARSIKEVQTKLSELDKSQVNENYLRKIFHPLGGSLDRSFDAKDLRAGSITSDRITSSNWTTGQLGSGFCIEVDPDSHDSSATIDYLTVRKEARYNRLTIDELRSVGGSIMLSAASAVLTRVESVTLGDSLSVFRCYYLPKGGEQLWRAGDQGRCQRVEGKELKYYWRYVHSVSEVCNADGEFYIDLSKSKVDGSGEPAGGDELVLLGHQGSDNSRKNAIVISSGTLDHSEPSITSYKGVDSFSTSGKQQIHIGDRTEFKVNSFTIVGDDGTQYKVPKDRGAWSMLGEEKRCYNYDRVSHKGSLWLCNTQSDEGTTVEPSVESDEWICEVERGAEGERGNYQVTAFRWAESKPAKPVGSSPEEWSVGINKGKALIDHSGAVLKDELGNLMIDPYPDSYRLWGSTATFSGATDELVGEWSDTYQVSGENGKPGETPVIYELLPSATAVKKDTAGALSPATVNCHAVLRYGNQREVIGVDPKIEFAGRNLVLNSNRTIERQPGSYDQMSHYKMSRTLEVGKTYVLSCDIEVGAAPLFFLWTGVWETCREIFIGVPFSSNLNYGLLMMHDSHNSNLSLLRWKNVQIETGSVVSPYQPAPEDYAIQLNGADYTAGTAVTPTDSLNWTLHEPITYKEIDRKTTMFQEDIEIGGRNLALNTSTEVSNAYYPTRTFNLSENLIPQTVYTATFKGELGVGRIYFQLFMGGGYTTISQIMQISDGSFKLTFKCPSTIAGNGRFDQVNVYAMPNGSSVSKISKFKLERGNRATDWSPAPEDVQAEITAAKAEAKDEACKEIAVKTGFASWDAMVASYAELGQTIIKGGYINTDLIEAEAIVAQSGFIDALKTCSFEAQKATVGKLITSGGQNNQRITIFDNQINMYDGDKIVTTMSGQVMPLVSEFNNDGGSGQKSYGGFDRTTASTYDLTSNPLTGIIAGSVIRIATTIYLSGAPGRSLLNPPIWAGSAGVEVILMRKPLLGSWAEYKVVSKELAFGNRREVVLDEKVSVEHNGDYALRFKITASPNSVGSISSVDVSAISFSFNYLDNNKMRALWGSNGWALRGNKDNYFHVAFTNGVMNLTAKGNFDMPGVLAKANISGLNVISRKWGKNIIRVESATTSGANKKVVIEKIDGEYSAICTPYGGGSMPVVYNEQPTYFEVYATGGFNVMLVGKN